MKIKIIFFLILLLGFLVRFYRFTDRIDFSPEQGLALQTAGDFINVKFSLLGQKTFLRTTSQGHILYSGPLFNYFLIPLQKIFNYQVIPITAVFSLINIFTGVVMLWVVKKIINLKVGLMAFLLFVLNDYMIFHSMHVYLLNFLPLMMVLTILFLANFKKDQKVVWPLFIGLLGGLGFNMEYVYLFTALLTLLLIILWSKRKIVHLFIFLVGAAAGNFTMIVFDLMHEFYYSKSLWQYFVDTLTKPSQSQISSYHFLQFWPLGIIFLAYLITKINKTLAYAIFGIYLFLVFTSSKVSFSNAAGMLDQTNYQTIDRGAQIIANDKPAGNFNIVYLPGADFRANSLRYLLNYVYKVRPMGMEEYASADYLYVFGPNSYDINSNQPWEIQVLGKPKLVNVFPINEKFSIYKITK